MAKLLKIPLKSILFTQKSNVLFSQIRNYSYRYRFTLVDVQREIEKRKCPPPPPGDYGCAAIDDTMSELDWDLLWERAKTEGTCCIGLVQRKWCASCPTLPDNLPHCKNISRTYCGIYGTHGEAPYCEKIKCPYQSYSEYQAGAEPKKKILSQCEICPKSQRRLPTVPNPKRACTVTTRIFDPCTRMAKDVLLT